MFFKVEPTRYPVLLCRYLSLREHPEGSVPELSSTLRVYKCQLSVHTHVRTSSNVV